MRICPRGAHFPHSELDAGRIARWAHAFK